MKVPISIGIPAYNEEKNIGKLLTALLHQRTKRVTIDEIIVISSGSTDKTDEIVRRFSERDERIMLVRQEQRKGKASAVNEFLKIAENKILVLESADTIPAKETIESLCLPLLNEKVGMVGAHPIPTNDKNTFMGYAVHLLWELHNQISLRTPKCGELVAFRKLFEKIPEDTSVDEAWIEYEIKKRGYKIVYVPSAIVYNKGPETIKDYIKQRRRITCGHIDLKKRTGYRVSTTNLKITLAMLLRLFPYKKPKEWTYFVGACTLEGLGRLLGYYDYYINKRKHVIWEIARTTKEVNVSV